MWSQWVPVLGVDAGIDYPRVGMRVPWAGSIHKVVSVMRDGPPVEHSFILKNDEGGRSSIRAADWYLGSVGRLIRVA